MKKKASKKRALGRPSTYTPAKGRAICKLLAEGWTLNQVCKRLDLNSRTVRTWALDIAEFSTQYTRAREIGYHKMADDLLDVADDGSNDWMEGKFGPVFNKEAAERSKLRVDTRKWLLSKALPKLYGDKLDVKHDASADFVRVWSALAAGQVEVPA